MTLNLKIGRYLREGSMGWVEPPILVEILSISLQTFLIVLVKSSIEVYATVLVFLSKLKSFG